MTQRVTFTERARRDCRKVGVTEDDAREAIDNPEKERQHRDGDDVFIDSVRGLSKKELLVVTSLQQVDGLLVYRVFRIHRDELK